jgi:hypothetical protein
VPPTSPHQILVTLVPIVPESGGAENLIVPSAMEMEGSGLRKRDRPEPQVETSTVDEGLSKRDRPDPQVQTSSVGEDDLWVREQMIFWDELERGLWPRPLGKDGEHTEPMDFAARRRAAEEVAAAALAAEYYSEDDEDEPGWLPRRFRDRWNSSWSGADRHGDFEDTSKFHGST